MNIGENIYNYRTGKGMSQTDLANALEVSRQSVSKWENNSAVPDLERIIKMSELFEITLDELVFGKKSEIKNSVLGPRPKRGIFYMINNFDIFPKIIIFYLITYEKQLKT